MIRCLLLCAALAVPGVASAQAIKEPAPMKVFSEAEVEAVSVPLLEFQPTQDDVDTYEKYFYFHRSGTSFDEAYHDIRACDALARGISFNSYGSQVMYDPSMAGVLGGMIGSAIADAIFGSAERRRIRRVNLRNCMGFKGYKRYGLERNIWSEFNFEEGNATVEDEKRDIYLMQQAKVASGPTPTQEALQP